MRRWCLCATLCFLVTLPSLATNAVLHVEERDGTAFLTMSGDLDCNGAVGGPVGFMAPTNTFQIYARGASGKMWYFHMSGFLNGERYFNCNMPAGMSALVAHLSTPLRAWSNQSTSPSGTLSIHHWGTTYGTTWLNLPVVHGPLVPAPAACVVVQSSNINFGSFEAKDTNGKKAYGSLMVECSKQAAVIAKFVSRTGSGSLPLGNGITADLQIDGKPGATGAPFIIAGSKSIAMSATLVDKQGQAKPGPFSATAVLRLEVY